MKKNKSEIDGNFRIIQTIGEGTYSSVFKAIDQRNNSVVALKRVKLEKLKMVYRKNSCEKSKHFRDLIMKT